MFNTTCQSCGHRFHLKETRLDEHWHDSTFEPAFCYCPRCDAKLDDVLPQTADAAKTLTPKFFGIFCVLILVSLVALATNSLAYVGSISISLFGVYLARSARTRDHRIIGYFLLIVGIGLLALAFN